MTRLFAASVLILSTVAFGAAAEAKGCIKGAIVGGIAGHMAGHGVVGAAAGCAVGRHRANNQDRRSGQAQRPDAR